MPTVELNHGRYDVTDEAALKRDLVLACRILADQGQGDGILGHVTARLPDWDRCWMKPTAMGLDEVEEDDLILIDFDGKVLAGHRPRHEEFPIHTEIMRRRPEVLSVVHTHPEASIALAARGSRLRPVSHEGSYFWPPEVPIFGEFTDLVRTRAQGEAVASAIGDLPALFLRNHGITTCGPTIAEAVMTALFLERASRIQLLAQPTADAPVEHTPEAEARAKKEIFFPERLRAMFDYYGRAVSRR
jgi:ribulose-5-phosphate 4-epimerase/fuculose-1-phosphate aldolase